MHGQRSHSVPARTELSTTVSGSAFPLSARSLSLGERIEQRYTLLERLSAAPPCYVFRVRDEVSGHLRVLKGVEAAPASPDGLQLRREFELLSRLRHPSIVRVHQCGLTYLTSGMRDESPPIRSEDLPGGREPLHPFLYFTLDYVEGPPLRSLLSRPLAERLTHFVGLVDAVAAVHAHGLRCGDLKPENVLLGPSGVQLIDFGLSREAESLEVARIPTGTLPYMAPELLRGQAADARSDLFSLGVILFELLAGHVPFPEADTLSSRLQAWTSLKAPPHLLLPDAVRNSLRESVVTLLDRLLAARPAARAANCEGVRRSLETIVTTWNDGESDPGPSPQLPLNPPFVAEQDLVGREPLLEQLRHVWREAHSGGHRYIKLQGPQGIGRSRVLDALALELLIPTDGRLILLRPEGTSEASRVALEHWLAGEALTSESPAWLQALAEGALLAERHLAPLPVLLLDEVSCLRPVSAGGVLAAESALPAVLVVEAVGGSSAEGSRSSSALTFEVPPLPESAVRGLVEQASGLVRAPETIARFYRFSEGNPGILRAILLHPNEMLEPSPTLMRLLEPLVAQVLDALPTPLLELAQAAALLFEPFGAEVLAAIAESPRERLAGALEQLSSAGILGPELETAGAWRFVHPMQRAALAAQLSPERRLEMHSKVARLLERRAQLGAAIPNAALAWHWDRAEDPERARRYLGRALRDAVAASRQLEAHDLCQRLLERLSPDDPERVRIYTQLGDINLALQRFPLAEASFVSAIQTLEGEEDADSLVLQLRGELLSRLGKAREERGDFVGAREAYEQALALLASGRSEADPGSQTLTVPTPEAGRLALSLARVCHREGRLDLARQALGSGLRALEQDPSPAELAEAHLLDALIRLDSGALEEAVEPLQKALALATMHQLPPLRMRALHNLHIVEARRHQLPKAVEYLQQALELAESLGDVARLGAGYNNLGNLQRRLGDVRRALKSYRQAARTFERVGDRAGLVTVHYSQANLLRERGEFGRSLENLDAADALAEAIGGGFREQALRRTRLLRGEVLLALGQLDEAQRLLELSHQESEAGGDAEALLASELALAEVSLTRGDTLGVEQRLADLAARARGGRQELGFYRTLGRLHFHLGHYYSNTFVGRCRDVARQVLGNALLEQVQAVLPEQGPTELRTRLEEAIILLEANGQGQLATQARGLLQGLGASSEERLELLGSVLDVLQHLGDRRKVLAYLVALATRVLQAERGLLLYRRNEGDLLDFTVLHGMNLGEAQRVSEEIVRRVARTKGPVIVADALEDASLLGSSSIHDLQIRSVLGLPLEGDEAGMWILYLDHRQLPGVFSRELGPLLERLRLFASGLLREIRWREAMLARVQEPGRDDRRLGMVGVSRAIERVREYIENLGHLKLTNENLLFIGESGTGKELVARAVHQVVRGDREIPFIAQSCADIPTELIESILFGHRRGSFTGAKDDRAGIFELANGGVLFLDEIGELPLHLQPSLLRVLEERSVARVGEAEKQRPLNLIVVFATNRDLAKEVEAGRFRRDLFHRLNQVFRLPPLRERREDILPLVEHFMGRVEDFRGLSAEELFSPEVLLWFHEYEWLGNVRELRNMIEAIPVRIKARRHLQVTLEDIGAQQPHGNRSGTDANAIGAMGSESLKTFTERMETAYIRRVMEQCDWDITAAAARLGITYQGLRKRILKYDWMDEVEKHR